MQEKSKLTLAIVSDCERDDLRKYRPADEIVNELNHLFSETVLARITDLTRDLKPFLIHHGFKVLQYPYSATSAIVVEHPRIERFVIKFARDPHTAARGKFNERLQIVKKRSLATRAVNADRLNMFLRERHFNHVRVPKKFFCCVANRFPVLLAEKLSLATHRSVIDLGPEEIKEILAVVEFSRGTLDLWPRNIILLDNEIQFIDLERQEEPSRWQTIILDSVKDFRDKVNPLYRPLMETWFARVSQRGELLETSLPIDKIPSKALKLAVVAEDVQRVRQLLKDNVFEAVRLDKMLFKATESGNIEIVEMLLENGANPTIQNKRGFTALDLARGQGNQKVIHLLESAQFR